MFIIDVSYTPPCHGDQIDCEYNLVITWYEFCLNEYRNNIPDCSSVIKIIKDSSHIEPTTIINCMKSENSTKYKIHITSSTLIKLTSLSHIIQEYLFSHYSRVIKNKCTNKKKRIFPTF
jgi:hypothetical protein